MSQRKLFALLVGIDKYAPPVPALEGCVNDMHSVRDYLISRESPSSFSLDMQVLENESATRLNIVRQFENHLSKAGEDDIAMFFYCGHGSQEAAHPAFWAMEPDHLNETIVCYDSRLPDGMDLADKELATLLAAVAERNPHLVVMQDCCNSGSGTRSVGMGEPGPSFRSRTTATSQKTRSLDSYILPRSFMGTRGIEESTQASTLILPKARHVHLAAAQSFEEAKETTLGGSPRGVFTYSLMEVLSKAQGPLSYQDLNRRVRNLVTQRTYNQVPQIYSSNPTDSDLLFLDGLSSKGSGYFSMYFDQKKRQFAMDAGAAHGIPKPMPGQPSTEIYVFAEDADDTEMSNPDMSLGSAQVTAVDPGHSWVSPAGDLALDPAGTYKARFSKVALPPMNVFFRGDSPEAVNLLRQAFQSDSDARLFLAETPTPDGADYWAVAKSSPSPHFLIARPLDEVLRPAGAAPYTEANKEYKPLVKQVQNFTPDTAKEVIGQMEHIARYQRLLNLDNPSSFLPAQSLQIQLFEGKSDQIIQPGPDGYVFSYREADGPDHYPQFRIKAINGTGRKLFASLIYFSPEFESDPNLFPSSGVWLEAGAEAWGLEGQAVTGMIPDEFVSFGVKEQKSYLKLILSTSNLDANQFTLPSLGVPIPSLRTRSAGGEVNTRSLMFASPTNRAPGEDWNANFISIIIRRED